MINYYINNPIPIILTFFIVRFFVIFFSTSHLVHSLPIIVIINHNVSFSCHPRCTVSFMSLSLALWRLQAVLYFTVCITRTSTL